MRVGSALLLAACFMGVAASQPLNGACRDTADKIIDAAHNANNTVYEEKRRPGKGITLPPGGAPAGPLGYLPMIVSRPMNA